ncbi:MAG: MMPL family transporter [Candidatus Omnitrophica bacterium]|nr:MMPL family transporter [Candidatus Omnitrophota bacterium]
MIKNIIQFAVKRPKIIMLATVVLVVTALFQFPKISVDTDPENMLPEDAPVRVFHNDIKKEFAVYDMIVLGIVNEQHAQGVFNVQTLTKIYNITEEIEKIEGVIKTEIIAPSTKDDIGQAGLGAVSFNWLMETPPKSEEEAKKISRQAQNHPIFKGTVVSENGKALCLYVPIDKKDTSYEIAEQIRAIYSQYEGDEEYYITGLPVANDQFGAEMFKQMAVSAPLAGLVIFLLMLFFFKSAGLVIAPMIVAIATVAMTMGLLIGFRFPVHIMSSMIPIFLMPIAVLDSVHILSEFFDVYPKVQDKKKTILIVVDELFSPMLFTSLTSAVGFFSLSFSPIPPVQIFGVFVAIGVLIAWALTITLIPAYIMLLNEKSFTKMMQGQTDQGAPILNKMLQGVKHIVVKKYKVVFAISLLLVGLSIYGMSRIKVNDNPVRWFNAKHPIRVADKILNHHFAGTYEAYLVMEAANKDDEVFLRPDMLVYVEKLQRVMQQSNLVGKSTSLTDIVKKIYYELLGGDKANNVIPRTKQAVAQSLISFENSHKPDDLWHFTTPDYSKLNLWIQLKSGDNKDMDQVVKTVNQYIKNNPPPYSIKTGWAGLAYINVVWQNNMVGGMLKNFMGSFVIVLFMMLFLFRSPVKALISMIPLTVTILFIYSLLGLFGKDYDMPVAVLSALTLGLSIDFAIHFIQRAIEVNHERNDWNATAEEMFRGPGRAIVRNALVVAIGFLPLLASPLIPYKTVGFFMFTIMAVSSLATLFILPAIISFKPQAFFKKSETGVVCHCGHCMLIALFVGIAVAYVLLGYTAIGFKPATLITIGIIVVFAGICHVAAKRKICITEETEK